MKKKKSKTTKNKTTKITLNHLAKIEGHAKLQVKIEKGVLKKVDLSIYEGARYFEGILKNKKFNDIPDITSRICGVCSVVHSIASIKAIENAFGIAPTKQTIMLRNLLNIGGIIQSHVLHLYMMSLSDYLGYGSAIEMAGSKDREHIERALRLKKAGNLIVNTLGGRDIHPIAARPGGFSKIPAREEIKNLVSELKKALPDALKTVQVFSSLKYPDFKKKIQYFSLQIKLLQTKSEAKQPKENYFDYSSGNCDKIACTGNACIPIAGYQQHLQEYFKAGSTAEFAKFDHQNYNVGAAARIINNFNSLSDESKKYAKIVLQNKESPFANLTAQAVEVYEGINTCINSLELAEPAGLKQEEPIAVNLTNSTAKSAGKGIGVIEAPRGTLFHKYEFDKEGYCTFANITTPTTQNLPEMEDALKHYVPTILHKSKEEIILEIEKIIRAYDPCISCATHFLEVDWDETK